MLRLLSPLHPCWPAAAQRLARSVIALATLSSALTLGRPVLAQSSPSGESPAAVTESGDKDAQARALFQQGKAAYTAGDFRLAWTRFREAYVLSQRPALLYNVGQAADRLGQTQEALASFRLYLRALPNAANADKVRERIAVLESDLERPETVGGTLPDEPEEPAEEEPASFDLYLHGGAGLGLYFASFQDEGGFEGSIRGLGLALDIGGGIPLADAFVVGALIAINYQPAPSIVQGNNPSESMGAQLAWGIGPEVTFFLSPTERDVYLRGAVLLSGTDAARRGNAVGSSAAVSGALGAAFLLGGGYEVPLTDSIKYGIGGRATLSLLSEDTISYVGFSLSVLGTLSFQ